MRNGTMTASGNGWSWLCCKQRAVEDRVGMLSSSLDYYPEGTEQPMDHTMITRAVSLAKNALLSAPANISVIPQISRSTI